VHLTWALPTYLGGVVAGYRVFRRERGTAALTPLADVSELTTSYDDASAQADRTYLYYVCSLSAGTRSSSVEAFFEVTDLWDPIWEVHRQINDDDSFSMDRMTLELGKYRLTFNPADYVSFWYRADERGNLKRYKRFEHPGYHPVLVVERLPEWLTEYRIGATNVDYRFTINLRSTDIGYNYFAHALIDILSAATTVRISRPFSVGVLTSDVRSRDILSETAQPANVEGLVLPTVTATPGCANTHTASALSAKPVGPTQVEASANIKFKLTTWVFTALALTLAGAGAAVISSLLFALGPLIDAAGVTLLTAVLTGSFVLGGIAAIEAALKAAIERRIVNRLTSAEQKEKFDRQHLLWFAGEGLAEALAKAVIRDPAFPQSQSVPGQPAVIADPYGRDRFRPQFWQMAVVENGKCQFTFRL
jgi:hypothetical protein